MQYFLLFQKTESWLKQNWDWKLSFGICIWIVGGPAMLPLLPKLPRQPLLPLRPILQIHFKGLASLRTKKQHSEHRQLNFGELNCAILLFPVFIWTTSLGSKNTKDGLKWRNSSQQDIWTWITDDKECCTEQALVGQCCYLICETLLVGWIWSGGLGLKHSWPQNGDC